MERGKFGGGPSPGGSGSSSGRLPSFRKPRDLTLGGAGNHANNAGGGDAKKKFVPNLNVTRNKKEGAASSPKRNNLLSNLPKAKQASSVASAATGKKPQSPQAAKRGLKGGRAELIQTSGSVFQDGVGGPGSQTGRRRATASSTPSPRVCGNEPATRPRAARTGDIKEEAEDVERRRKGLLQGGEGFLADLEEGLFVPVQLPMIDTGKVFKEQKEEPEKEVTKRKGRPNRILDSDDSDDEVKPETEERKVVATSAPTAAAARAPADKSSFAELLKDQKGDLLFVQLPDHLPGSVAKEEEGGGSDGSRRLCSLADLPEGYLGKIQVRQSGRAQLVLGDGADERRFDLEAGTRVGFLQDFVSVSAEASEGGEATSAVGQMTVLGHVKHRLVVTPDWSHLLKAADEEEAETSEEDEDS